MFLFVTQTTIPTGGWVAARRADQVGLLPTQPSLAEVGVGAELGKRKQTNLFPCPDRGIENI